ncbi:MAG TPA: ABC transporter permease subunit, partial [Clostridia bacterium]|nr:ABC transporter permease subunit [Clostridia bacterium]
VLLLFTFTMYFSGGMIPTYLVIRQLGLINNFFVMILPGALSVYNLIVMRTFFQTNIPYELYEVAEIDGCSQVGMLRRIALPLSKPILAVMVLFYGVAHWNAFFDALLYLQNNRMHPLQLVLRRILLQAFSLDEMVTE